MLQRVGETVDPQDAVVKIKNASFPAPFASELEYNSPVHGNWNIVHTGMLVPEAIQIYVCADNCMRGVVLTAAEMNAAVRISHGYTHRPKQQKTGRYVLRHKFRGSHIHPDRAYPVRIFLFYQLQTVQSCIRLDQQIHFFCFSMIIHIFSQTADAIAAHFCRASIRIVQFHPKICLRMFRIAHTDNTIGSDTAVPVTEMPYQLR